MCFAHRPAVSQLVAVADLLKGRRTFVAGGLIYLRMENIDG